MTPRGHPKKWRPQRPARSAAGRLPRDAPSPETTEGTETRASCGRETAIPGGSARRRAVYGTVQCPTVTSARCDSRPPVTQLTVRGGTGVPRRPHKGRAPHGGPAGVVGFAPRRPPVAAFRRERGVNGRGRRTKTAAHLDSCPPPPLSGYRAEGRGCTWAEGLDQGPGGGTERLARRHNTATDADNHKNC